MPQIAFLSYIHNGEKSMRRSIESVLNQAGGVELVYYLVDNASTDSTWEIMCEYAAKDPRVRLIQNENSLVRLPEFILGITDCAYFSILDADDLYYPDFAARMIAFMEKEKLDIAACGSDMHDTVKEDASFCRKIDETLLLAGSEAADRMSDIGKFFPAIWAKVFRMDTLRQTDFSLFDRAAEKKVFYFVDTIFVVSVLKQASRIGISAQVLHQYEIDPETDSYRYNPDRFFVLTVLVDTWLDFFGRYGGLQADRVSYIVINYLAGLSSVFHILFRSTLSAKDKLEETKKLLEYPLTSAWNGFMGARKEQLFRYIIDTAKGNENNKKVVKLTAECIALLKVEGI